MWLDGSSARNMFNLITISTVATSGFEISHLGFSHRPNLISDTLADFRLDNQSGAGSSQ
jgi:hypothetical protein